MADAASDTRSVIVEREFPYPPDKIWRALTQPHLIEEWLMTNDFNPLVGQRFNFRAEFLPNGSLDCEVLAVEPHRKLSYTWGSTSENPAFNLKSVVTWTLTPTRAGTHLRMEQSGFGPKLEQAYQGAKLGWPRRFTAVEQTLARMG